MHNKDRMTHVEMLMEAESEFEDSLDPGDFDPYEGAPFSERDEDHDMEFELERLADEAELELVRQREHDLMDSYHAAEEARQAECRD